MAEKNIWTTWSKQHQTQHEGLMSPRSAFELQEMVQVAGQEKQALKVIGACKSSSAIAQPVSQTLSLEYLSGLTHLDQDAQRATFLAGTTIADASKILESYGFAFENLGFLSQQTLAGAISTGSHGTGTSYGIFATQVQALDLVTSTGELISCSENHKKEIFKAALVGLGSLGIIVSLSFKVVPLFRLHAAERGHSYDKIVHSFTQRSHGADHYEFTWFPGSAEVRTRRLTRLNLLPDGFLRPHARISQLRRHGGDHLLNNGIFEAMSYLGAKVPATQKTLNKISNWGKGNRRYADLAHKVFTTNRRVLNKSMEYAFPLENFAEIMEQLRQCANRLQNHSAYPLLVRTSAGDKIPLSPAYGRETFYICAREYWRSANTGYFEALEEVFTHYEGRPHWGQLHSQDANSLEKLYPEFKNFVALREKMDPEGIFLNPYLEGTLLGKN